MLDPLAKVGNPQARIWVAIPGNSYNYAPGAGTSFAAPFVSGVAGLMISRNSSLMAAQIKLIIQATADHTGKSDPAGYAIRHVNAFGAVQQAITGQVITFDSTLTTQPKAGFPSYVYQQIDTQGYNFTSTNPNSPGFDGLALGSMTQAQATDGTTALSQCCGYAVITMQRGDGRSFSLSRFDAGEMSYNPVDALYVNATGIAVTGTSASGGTVSVSFPLDAIADGPGGVNDFQTFNLGTGWENLISITFAGLGPCISTGCRLFQLDNLVVK